MNANKQKPGFVWCWGRYLPDGTMSRQMFWGMALVAGGPAFSVIFHRFICSCDSKLSKIYPKLSIIIQKFCKLLDKSLLLFFYQKGPKAFRDFLGPNRRSRKGWKWSFLLPDVELWVGTRGAFLWLYFRSPEFLFLSPSIFKKLWKTNHPKGCPKIAESEACCVHVHRKAKWDKDKTSEDGGTYFYGSDISWGVRGRRKYNEWEMRIVN